MIDLGLSKLALIGVVALVVIGPEKLPKVARMAGTLYGRAQRYITQVKSEVSREIELDELRKMQQEAKEAVSGFERSVADQIGKAESSISNAWDDQAGADMSPLREPPTPDQLAVKIKNFRKTKLARSSAVPIWYKRQSGHRSRVISGAARVARYRPRSSGKPTRSFY
jgi:sec-independent protein translocase protein TatB